MMLDSILSKINPLRQIESDPHRSLRGELEHLKQNPHLHSKPPQPAMTSITEQAYCEWYARELYSGQGAIVELGCWLGSLTASLAKGLQANPGIPPEMRRINVMDYFKWDVVMEDWVEGTRFAGRVQDGGDFQKLYREAIADILEMVDISQADLSERGWKGGAIEFLLIDCMKRIEVASNVARSFFPQLIPGASYVAHQDYLHFFHSWIHVLMYRLRNSIQPVLTVPGSSTVVFKCVRRVRPRQCKFPRSFAEVSPEEIDAAFDWNFEFVDEDLHDAIAAAKVSAFVHKGELDVAKRLYSQYISDPYPESIHFERMHDFFQRFEIVDLKKT